MTVTVPQPGAMTASVPPRGPAAAGVPILVPDPCDPAAG